MNTSEYSKIDHSHCWESKNPPCGQKIKHFDCCLCIQPHPDTLKIYDQGKKDAIEGVIKKAEGMQMELDKLYQEYLDTMDAVINDGTRTGVEIVISMNKVKIKSVSCLLDLISTLKNNI